MYHTIFFDWNKTLSNSLFFEQLKTTDNEKYSQIESILFNKDYNLILPWMRGEFDYKYVLDFISEKTNISTKFLEENLVNSCKNMSFIDDGVIANLKSLKTKCQNLVIATDNMDVFTLFTAPELTTLGIFSDYLNSYYLKAFKYDVSEGKLPFFDNYLQEHKLNYSDVLLIDDSIDKKGNLSNLGFKIEYIREDRNVNDVMKELYLSL